jgi:peptidoglycan/LPS O-acetylase OafA/YrhL
MKYRPEVDGLRAVAVLPVLFFHAGFESFGGGFVGVDVFFVISGFLITRILVDEMEAGRFSMAAFYERRARRILPALFVMLVLCVPAAWVLLPPSAMVRFSESLVAVPLFASNILFWRQSGYFDTAAELKPLLHTWSLAVEEQYYILFPIVLLAVFRLNRRLLVPVLLAGFVMSLWLAEWLVLRKPGAAFFLLPTRGWELLLGALVAVLGAKLQVGAFVSNMLCALGLGMIAAAVAFFTRATPTPGLQTLLPTVGAALVLLYARSSGSWVGWILCWRPAVWVGLISYSAYLWHQPLLAFFRYAAPGELGLVRACVALACSIGFGYLSWRFVEMPIRNPQKVARRAVVIFGVLGVSLISAVGVAGYLTQGFLDLRSADSRFVRDAALQRDRTERQKLIRAGTCHFDENLPIVDFVAKWNCTSADEKLQNSRIAVFGDSHAADKVVALRLNGVDTWQITGAGCQLAPEHVKADRKHCLALYRLFESQKAEIRGVILANRFPVSELTPEYIQAVLRYWGNVDIPVVMFAPMPDFDLQQQEYAVNGTTNTPPSFARESRFWQLLEQLAVPPNVSIVKASEHWCGSQGCAVARDSHYLMTDEDHLSGRGAERFGRSILEDVKVRALLAAAAAPHQ